MADVAVASLVSPYDLADLWELRAEERLYVIRL